MHSIHSLCTRPALLAGVSGQDEGHHAVFPHGVCVLSLSIAHVVQLCPTVAKLTMGSVPRTLAYPQNSRVQSDHLIL